MKVVRNIAAGTGVLVHCSDGWDRTPQITSLSSIVLDPYYRTALGFLVLIEKEWCNMGHKFADRLSNSVKKDQEESPVFLQWLDCVWQLWRQCPIAFEFNEDMLLHLADQVYSGRWSHFTVNCDHDLEKDEALAAMLSNGPVACPPSFASVFLDAEASPKWCRKFCRNGDKAAVPEREVCAAALQRCFVYQQSPALLAHLAVPLPMGQQHHPIAPSPRCCHRGAS